MDFHARHVFRLGRRLVLPMVGVVAGLTMATASPASAAPASAVAWGNNDYGQLGDDMFSGPSICSKSPCSPTPVAVSGLGGIRTISAGDRFSLAVLHDGTVMAWGRNASGQLGDGTATGPSRCGVEETPCSTAPVTVGGLSKVIAVAAGGSHSLALLSNGTIMAWGSNSSGQLGDDSRVPSDVPVPIPGLRGVIAISAGFLYSLAVLHDGTVMAWGENSSGQLGDSNTVPSDVPLPVTGLSGVIAISAGGAHSLALLRNGTVMAWGENTAGELGNGEGGYPDTSDVPVAVSNLSGVNAVSAGEEHSLALLPDGKVMAWGRNIAGELGSGVPGPEGCFFPDLGDAAESFPCSKIPVPVSGLTRVKAISAGSYHSLALVQSGAVVSWGFNFQGQLGNGSREDSDVPVFVSGLSGARGIAAGGDDSFAFGPMLNE